jgi:hypothetical protein
MHDDDDDDDDGGVAGLLFLVLVLIFMIPSQTQAQALELALGRSFYDVSTRPSWRRGRGLNPVLGVRPGCETFCR